MKVNEMSAEYLERLDARDDLPPIPHTLHQVLGVLDDASTSAKEIEHIVEQDPILTAKILRLANSPYYGLQGEVGSIARAIVILGVVEVRNLVIGLSLTSAFNNASGFEEFDPKGLWIHSIGVGKAARMIADLMPGVDRDAVFTAGLIHDLGRFLLCMYFPDELREILAMREAEGLSLTQAEERYGLSHCDLGSYLAARWGLGDLVANVMRYHHRPQGAGPHAIAAGIVFLADALCQKVGIGWTMAGEVDKILVPRNLGLDPGLIKDLALRLRNEKDSIVGQWSGVLQN